MKERMSTEARIEKQGYTQQYVAGFDKMYSDSILVKLSEEEMANFTRPVHYLPHIAVMYPSSTSTALRIIAESAFK